MILMFDIVFIMLIFFIVIVIFVKETGIEVDKLMVELVDVKKLVNILVVIFEKG